MPEQLISVEHLRIGMYVRLQLKWYEHPFLFSSFKIRTPQQILTIKELGLTHVLHVPEKSDKPEQPADEEPQRTPSGNRPASPEELWQLKQERIAINRVRNQRIQHCERCYEETLNEVKQVMQSLMTGSQEAVDDAGQLVNGVVETLLSDQEVVIHLVNAKGQDEGVFYHTLNVAVLAMILGRECGLEADAMQKLGLGALFHDIGKYRIPKKLLYKQAPLTNPERALLQMHPQYGEEIVSKLDNFSAESIEVIRQHHETMDGKGYPDRLPGDDIALLARITAIANSYDNLCNQLDPLKSVSPHEALSCMYKRYGSRFDLKLLPHFIRCLGIYPPGTLVQLSNEAIGLVVSINPGNQLRPNILIYDPGTPRNEALIIDLAETPDLQIQKSLRPPQLPPEAYAYLNPRMRVNYFIDALPAAASTQ